MPPVAPVYHQLIDKKNHFFTEYRGAFFNASNPASRRNTITAIDTSITNESYQFLARAHPLVEQEFKQLLDALQTNTHPLVFWFFCYYCSGLLAAYYHGYGKKEEAAKYQKECERIKRYLGLAAPLSPVARSLAKRIKESLTSGFNGLFTAPFHSSLLRDLVTLSNIVRMQVAFSRVSVRQLVVLAKDIEALDKVLHTRSRQHQFIRRLDAPLGVLNSLSVALFAAHFFIELGTIVKHVFFPQEEERLLSWQQRLAKEVYKRHCGMINDLVWAIANTLTNFAPLFHISAPLAGWLLTGFLLFDVAFLFYRRHLGYTDYKLKKEQYDKELRQLERMMRADTPEGGCVDSVFERYRLLIHQQQQLEINWKTSQSFYACNLTAALLLLSGFTAAMLVSSAALLPVCFFVCALGVSLYIAAGHYSAYQEKRLRYQHAISLEQPTDKVDEARQEIKKARQAFIWSLLKSAVLPTFFMTLYVFCWPAAVALTALYVFYECTKSSFKPPLKEQTAPFLPVDEDPSLLPGAMVGQKLFPSSS